MKSIYKNTVISAIFLILSFLCLGAVEGSATLDGNDYDNAYTYKATDGDGRLEEVLNNLTNKNYYFTSGGTKYHLDRNCGYLKSSPKVYETDLYFLPESSLTPCSKCGNLDDIESGDNKEDVNTNNHNTDNNQSDNNDTSTDGSTPIDNNTSGNGNENDSSDNISDVYYYTKAGTKWHRDRNCRYIKNSKEIFEADKATVEGKGLTACSSCG